MLTVLRALAGVLAACVLTACGGLNVLSPEGFPVEDVQPNSPDGWGFTSATGGDDWAEYSYAVERGAARITLVVCVANGLDGVDHCDAIAGPARPITDFQRFPPVLRDIQGVFVCAGTDPCDDTSIDGLFTEWHDMR